MVLFSIDHFLWHLEKYEKKQKGICLINMLFQSNNRFAYFSLVSYVTAILKNVLNMYAILWTLNKKQNYHWFQIVFFILKYVYERKQNVFKTFLIFRTKCESKTKYVIYTPWSFIILKCALTVNSKRFITNDIEYTRKRVRYLTSASYRQVSAKFAHLNAV